MKLASRGPMILVGDRLNAHRSQEVKAYLAEHREIIVEWLPAYAPDLNPEVRMSWEREAAPEELRPRGRG